MKRLQSKRSSKPGAKNRAKTVDEYFANIEGPAHEMLTTMRLALRSVLPSNATEVISYGIPAFRQKKVLVWYAAFANHCSLFPGGAVLNEMKSDLDGFVTAKGTIQFPIGEPLPVALIKKIVKKRLGQIDKKA
ncbi:MAG TPA: DUF1801 domain-containing protein [Terriglobales bacterium]|nr:DUF1801 domain-containing protein [Terriglobales bacterium]